MPEVLGTRGGAVFVPPAPSFARFSPTARGAHGECASKSRKSTMPIQTQPDDRSTALTRAIGRMTGWLGSFPAIMLSFLLVGAWFLGALFVQNHFSNNTYQLLINIGTTTVT